MFNLVTFQMMYQIINWKTRLDRFFVSQVCRLIRMILRVLIASLFQDIVEMINKRVIVKFVNQKYSKGLLYKKKSMSSRDFSNVNISSKILVSVSLCPYYRFIWDKSKYLQRRCKIHQVFCLGRTLLVKIFESGISKNFSCY